MHGADKGVWGLKDSPGTASRSSSFANFMTSSWTSESHVHSTPRERGGKEMGADGETAQHEAVRRFLRAINARPVTPWSTGGR